MITLFTDSEYDIYGWECDHEHDHLETIEVEADYNTLTANGVETTTSTYKIQVCPDCGAWRFIISEDPYDGTTYGAWQYEPHSEVPDEYIPTSDYYQVPSYAKVVED